MLMLMPLLLLFLFQLGGRSFPDFPPHTDPNHYAGLTRQVGEKLQIGDRENYTAFPLPPQ